MGAAAIPRSLPVPTGDRIATVFIRDGLKEVDVGLDAKAPKLLPPDDAVGYGLPELIVRVTPRREPES